MSLTVPVPALAQERYTFSDDRGEVTDKLTGLIWQRCTQGQKLMLGAKSEDDSCTGSASYHTHEQALILAKDQSNWRVPNIKELASLVDISRQQRTINAKAFPGTFSYAYWSTTPLVVDSSFAWLVDFNNGHVLSLSRSNYFHVRLVR